jgi:hypothetical protein
VAREAFVEALADFEGRVQMSFSIRAISASNADFETGPASSDSRTSTLSPLTSQVPAILPPATTIGEIQPAVQLTSARREAARISTAFAWAEHVLVEGGKKPNCLRRRGAAQIIDILDEQEGPFAVDLDRGQAIA